MIYPCKKFKILLDAVSVSEKSQNPEIKILFGILPYGMYKNCQLWHMSQMMKNSAKTAHGLDKKSFNTYLSDPPADMSGKLPIFPCFLRQKEMATLMRFFTYFLFFYA